MLPNHWGTDWIGLGSTKQFTVTWMLTICRSSSSIPCLSSCNLARWLVPASTSCPAAQATALTRIMWSNRDLLNITMEIPGRQLAVLPCFMWILVVWKVTPELVSCRLSPRSAKLPERPNHPISGLNSGPMVRTHSRDGAANSSRKSSISACQYVSMSSNLLKY